MKAASHSVRIMYNVVITIKKMSKRECIFEELLQISHEIFRCPVARFSWRLPREFDTSNTFE